MKKIKFILDNFFVPGFLDSLLYPGALNRLMEGNNPIIEEDEPIFKTYVDELISWDLIASPGFTL